MQLKGFKHLQTSFAYLILLLPVGHFREEILSIGTIFLYEVMSWNFCQRIPFAIFLKSEVT